MVRMVRAGVGRGGRTVLVLEECRVYDGFQGYGREWMSLAEGGASLALYSWAPYGGENLVLDITALISIPAFLLGAISYNQ